MVKSIDIYFILNSAFCILSVTFLVFLVTTFKKTFSKVIRLICAYALVVIEAFKAPMEIAANTTSYVKAFIVIIVWLTLLVLSSLDLGEDL